MSNLYDIQYQLQYIPLGDFERANHLLVEMCVIMQQQGNDIIKLQSQVNRLIDAVPQAGSKK